MLLSMDDLHDFEKDVLHNHGGLSVLLVLCLIAAPTVIYYVYNIWKIKRWENSILNRKGDKTNRNISIAYMILVIHLMRNDTRESEMKHSRLNHALSKFSHRFSDLKEEYELLERKEIRVKHAASWINWHFSHDEREELMYLLIEIAYMDGSLIPREYQILLEIGDFLKISPRELKSMMASHKQRIKREQAERKRREREQRKKRQQHPTKSALKLAFDILGVSPYAGENEIKKAYRSLAKIHHPDRFSGQDTAIIKAAEARFIEIQQAYEILSA
ncbi:MAG: DnaJ domain-containing protein [Fluviicola sp.]